MKNKIGRLWGYKIYLAGIMDRVSEEEARGWREDISKFLYNKGIIPLNPCDKPIDVDGEIESKQLRSDLKENREFNKLSGLIRKNIRQPDLRLTDISDAIIVFLDIDSHACGTYEEIFWCNRQKMPIIIMCPQGVKSIPDWLYGALNWKLFFDNWDDVKNYINYIDDWNNNPDTLGKWVWINYYGLTKPLIERLN